MSPERSAFFNSDKHAQLVEAPIQPSGVRTSLSQRLRMNDGRRVIGHLARLALMHAFAHVDAASRSLGRRGGLYGQRVQQGRRVAPQLVEAVADQREVIEVFRLGQLLRFGDALAEQRPTG